MIFPRHCNCILSSTILPSTDNIELPLAIFPNQSYQINFAIKVFQNKMEMSHLQEISVVRKSARVHMKNNALGIIFISMFSSG